MTKGQPVGKGYDWSIEKRVELFPLVKGRKIRFKPWGPDDWFIIEEMPKPGLFRGVSSRSDCWGENTLIVEEALWHLNDPCRWFFVDNGPIEMIFKRSKK